jgi:hypothetical protein
MSWLKRLERRLEPFAIPNLTLYIVAGQTFFYLTFMLGLLDPGQFDLEPTLVLRGQVWRLLTFAIFPSALPTRFGWLFIAFVLYFLYLIGSALEDQWGAVRYNLFLFTGYLLTVAVAFFTPGMPADNLFINASIFLAFAYLYPDFTMYIFFILPIRARWMALFMWAGFALSFVTGGLAARLAVLAAVGNFLLFFSRDIWTDIKTGRRRMKTQAERLRDSATEDEPRHRCRTCGRNSNTDPQLDFRYCSQCEGDQCYCSDHIRNHVHVTAADEQAKS